MVEIKAKVGDKVSIKGNDYYKVVDEDNMEYVVPASQFGILERDKLFDGYHKFVKSYNEKSEKSFLSLLNPNYVIGKEYSFLIKSISKGEKGTFFILHSEYNDQLTVPAKIWQLDNKEISCQIVGYKKGLPILRNIDLFNSVWTIGTRREFEISGFGSFTDKSNESCASLIVNVGSTTKHVRCCSWQTSELWPFTTIWCKIVGIDFEGLPNLVVDDSRHPIFKVNDYHNFEIVDCKDILFKKIMTKSIVVKDSLGCLHDVLALRNQENLIKTGEIIECKIEKIATRITLRQTAAGDPYFYPFDAIISDVTALKKFVVPYIENRNEYQNLYNQYNSKSAFWVFTFCNVVIPKIKSDLLKRKDYHELLEVIQLHSSMEKWILSKGILKAFRNDDERKSIKIKIEKLIENNGIETKIINIILKLEVSSFLEQQLNKVNYRELYYLFRYSEISLIDEIIIFKILSAHDEHVSNIDRFYLQRISSSISTGIVRIKPRALKDYFVLSKTPEEPTGISTYYNWFHNLIKISQICEDFAEASYLIGKLYRFNAIYEKAYECRTKLLYNAFYVLSHEKLSHHIPTKIENRNIKIDLARVKPNPNLREERFDVSPAVKKAKVTEKHFAGYNIKIDNINGYLPTQNIFDHALKKFKFKVLDWETNVSVELYSREFNYLVASQLPFDSEYFYCKNLKELNLPKSGEVIFGTVKEIQYYGIFFYTEYGDSLLRKQNISNAHFDFDDIPLLFKVGDRIPLYVLAANSDRVELSFKHLHLTEYKQYYYNFFELYENEHSSNSEPRINDDYDYKIEVEKGFIFEEYAINQYEIGDKIKYLEFAKIFFSNTKNARSYLLNIYIEYFKALLKLDELLIDYSFTKYQAFKADVLEIKDKVEAKTIENYPESRNLLFFIDILNLFNSTHDEDLDLLFNIIRKPTNEYDSLLKVVAKTVLSNNLIISESSSYSKAELDTYTVKNLRRIRRYILHGVLSLEESIEDKVQLELQRKRFYWKNIIDLDEGEKLEFKSTFITPVPDNKMKSIILALEQELSETENARQREGILKRIDELKGLTAQKRIMHSALKTLVAFANTSGGTLLIGVSDDKNIFGIEQDYKSFKKGQPRDEFGKFFDASIKEYIGNSFSSNYLTKEFLKFPEGDILIVTVKPSKEEIFLLKDENGKKCENLYVRNLSSSEKLEGVELAKFIKNKFQHLISTYEVEITSPNVSITS